MAEKNEFKLCAECQDSFNVKNLKRFGDFLYCVECSSLMCQKCMKPIKLDTKCYQLRSGHFEKHDGDFHAYEDICFYHYGCLDW